MNSEIFNNQDRAQITALFEKAKKMSGWMTLYCLSATLNLLVFVGVMGFEYEISFQLFKSISGEDNEYWTPSVMAFSSVILVLGFHYLADTRAGKTANKFINGIAALLIPVNLIGIGLVIAVLLFNDGLHEMLKVNEDISFMLDTAAEVVNDDDWLGALMAQFTSPLAALAFSLGIGALAIINVFVAHRALTKIKSSVSEMFYRRSLRKTAHQAYQAICKVENAYTEKLTEVNTQRLRDETIQLEMASDILASLEGELLPVRVWVNKQKIKPEPLPFAPHPTLNLKQIEAALKNFSAITLDNILSHIRGEK